MEIPFRRKAADALGSLSLSLHRTGGGICAGAAMTVWPTARLTEEDHDFLFQAFLRALKRKSTRLPTER